MVVFALQQLLGEAAGRCDARGRHNPHHSGTHHQVRWCDPGKVRVITRCIGGCGDDDVQPKRGSLVRHMRNDNSDATEWTQREAAHGAVYICN